MTDKEALLEALEALHYCEALNRDVDERKMQAITVIRKLWTEHAMRETQRLGQEIEQEPLAHWSDCAVHSEPAYPKGKCDCGGIVAVADYTALSDKYVALSDKYVALKAQPEQEPVALQKSGSANSPSDPEICNERSAQACGPVYCGDSGGYCNKCPKQKTIQAVKQCKGMNCGCTDGRSHSLECLAELAAAVAGGVFVQEALAQPEQEPVAWWNDTGTHIDLNVSGRGIPLYTHPPQRTEQSKACVYCGQLVVKEKNT